MVITKYFLHSVVTEEAGKEYVLGLMGRIRREIVGNCIVTRFMAFYAL